MEHSTEPLPMRVKRAEPPNFIQWLPWEKMTIWGLFLALVFVMRHFFLIMFLTFITAYIMRSIVVRLAATLSPGVQRNWLERTLTIVCFILLLLSLYGLGNYFGPQLIGQAQALAGRGVKMNPAKELNSLLSKTVGVYLFSKEYGDRNDSRYGKEFEKFTAGGNREIVAYKNFETLEAVAEGEFELLIETEETKNLNVEIQRRGAPGREFDDWFLTKRAPVLLAQNKELSIAKWEARQASIEGEAAFETLKKRPDYEVYRTDRMSREILDQLKKDGARLADYVEEWKREAVARRAIERKRSPNFEASLKEYYERRREDTPATIPYDYEQYTKLKKAHREGQKAFAHELAILFPTTEKGDEEKAKAERERIEKSHADFQLQSREELAVKWWESDPLALAVRNAVGKTAAEAGSGIAVWVRDVVKYTITLPVQLGLSLLLSFFITFDIPNMKKGLARLQRSRAQHLYEEIAPSLESFGRLIGRSFQAQALIALCNTALTLVAIKLIGIENEIFLSAIVFICSFIPVVGVVLSSAPIAAMAIIQPGGTIWMAVLAIAAILVIHFIETSVFNPKIIGDMMHLHPVLVLTVLAVGEHFFGVWGLLLGTPVAVYIIRFIIFDEGIPGLIEPIRRKPKLEPT